MSTETLEMLIRKAFIYAEGEVTFAFQGGEPTLAGAAFYQKVIELERKYACRGIRVANLIQTNGYALENDLLDVLKAGYFLVGVSLDGTREIHDLRRPGPEGGPTYDRIRRNIGRLADKGIDCNILCVVDDEIAEQAQAVFDALKQYVFLQFIPCLDPLDSTGRGRLTPEKYGHFLSVIYRNYADMLRRGQPISVRTFDNWLSMLMGYPAESCGAMGCCSPSFLVEGNGNVYPCDFYALDEWLTGNIREQSFFRLARSEVQQRFLRESVSPDPACRTCAYYGLCHGGCKRESPDFARTGLRKTRLCAAYRQFFGQYLPDMKLLAKEAAQKMKQQAGCAAN